MIDRRNVSFERLQNGLDVVMVNQEWTDVFRCAVTVKFGSVHEQRQEDFGVAHFLEHMCFCGSPNYTVDDASKIIEGVGGNYNASTSYTRTSYTSSIPVKHIDRLLPCVDEMLMLPIFPEDLLEVERKVILEEQAARVSEPEVLVYENLRKMAYPDHGCGHPIIGYPESIAKISRDRICELAREHNRPANMVMVVSGNFGDDMIDRILELMPELTTADDEGFGEPDSGDPTCSPSQDVTETLSSVETSTSGRLYPLGKEMLQPKNRILSGILTTLMSQGKMSLLYKAARRDRGLCYWISMWPSIFTEHGCFQCQFQSRKQNVEEVEEIIDDVITQVREGDFDDDLFNWALNKSIGEQTYVLNSDKTLPWVLGKQLLFPEDMRLDVWTIEEQLEELTKMDLVEYARAAFPDGGPVHKLRLLNEDDD